jgi:large subunit ribosomal protein L31
MKKDIHPKNYRPVVFKDITSGKLFFTNSTVATKETIKMEDGKEYPLYTIEVSSESHPFYIGKNVLIDQGGRLDRFNKRYGKK